MNYIENLRFKPFIPIEGEKEIYKLCTYPKVQDNSYLISNYGNVYSLIKGRPMNPHLDDKGYYHITTKLNSNIVDNYKYPFYSASVHKLIAYEFCEHDEDRPYVNHIDGNPKNNYYKNLEYCTIKENTQHAVRLGLKKDYGEYSSNNVYKESDIRKICEYIRDGLSDIEICQEFGYRTSKINQAFYQLIRGIRRKKSWVRVSNEYF